VEITIALAIVALLGTLACQPQVDRGTSRQLRAHRDGDPARTTRRGQRINSDRPTSIANAGGWGVFIVRVDDDRNSQTATSKHC
jgi:hypothetical protein